ncbi:MAG: VCBS repeat-containing protein [Planctomycetales bacterium]|nr:VCBS repeat-containing protein [Planctomycetales bacterium]
MKQLYLLLAIILLSACSPDRSAQKETSPTSDATRDQATVAMRALTWDRPAAADATLFEQLDPGEIGIDFRHQWQPRDRHEAVQLKTGFTGGGVCLGDIDGDGLSDVLFTRPHGGARLYHNEGNFRFRDVTDAAGVRSDNAWTTGAAFVDVNQDGKLDIVICAYDSENLVYLNQGSLKFENAAPRIGLAQRGASVKLTFADYDGDGDLDAYLLTNRLEPKVETKIRYLGSAGHYEVAPEHRELAMVLNLPNGEQKFAKAGQADRLFKNELAETGELRFRDVTSAAELTGFYHGLDAIWWDYNRDGRPDLYVANDFTDPDQLFRNNGDGTFTDITETSLPCTPWFAMGASCCDVNNDGRFDLLATDMNGTSHYRQKMAMGSMDAVAWFLDTAEPRQYMRNALFVNSGTERFLEASQLAGLASSDWTWSIKVADLDSDGWEDVYATNGFTRDYLNSDFNLQLQKSGRGSDSMAWYEAPELKEANLAFRNTHELHFEKQSESWGLNQVGISFGAALGDLDDDGDLDLVVNNFDSPPSVYRNRATANRLKVRLIGNASNTHGVGATVELQTATGSQLRYVTPQNGFMSSNDTDVYFGLGKTQQVDQVTIDWPSGTRQTLHNVAANQTIVVREQADDATRDRAPTPSVKPSPLFTTTDIWPESPHRERIFDDFESQPLLPNKLSQLGPGLACGDVDGDGDVDVYQGGAAGQSGQLLLNDGSGRWRPVEVAAFVADAECEDLGCLLFDSDGDGDLDLFVASGGVESDAARLRNRLYLNDGVDEAGNTHWTLAIDRLPVDEAFSSSVAAADFDHDGDLDLCVGTRVVPDKYPLSGPSQLLENRAGTFVDVTEEKAPALLAAGMVTAVLWTDANGDGWSDLLLASEYGPIRCLLNEGGGRLIDQTEQAGLSAELGWWNSITAADVDADGDLDYAVGNFGLNTKYHPRRDAPQFVFFGDFSGDGNPQIVEAKANGESLLPTRGRSCSSNAMPFLKERFETYHSFASATLEEIYEPDKLQESVQLSVNRMESIVLINDGHAHFQVRPLPALAQFAPAFGMKFLYANDDSHLDLFVAQNFYTPQRETGRMNGGVGALLLGNGRGEFSAVWPDASGVSIPEDAKSVTSLDWDGDGQLELVIGTNDGSARMLKSNATNGSSRLLIQLKDSLTPATLRVEYEDRSLVVEVPLGDGYLSQSPAQIMLVNSAESPIRNVICVGRDGQQHRLKLDAVTNEHATKLSVRTTPGGAMLQ